MLYMLVVVFFLEGEQEPYFVEGFFPTLQTTLEICEQRGEMLKEQLDLMGAPPYEISCYKRVEGEAA